MTRKAFLFVFVLLTAMVVAFSAFGDDSSPWIRTGFATRTKVVFKVYDISHDMKVKVAKSGDAVVNQDCDKRFTLTFRRDVPKDKIASAFAETIDAGPTRDKLVAAFPAEIKEKDNVTIVYNAQTKVTTIWAKGGSTQTVSGFDESKKIWAIWFKRIDDSSVRNGLIANL